MRAKSNNRKIDTIVQIFIFKWRFICRSRRGCLSSLLPQYGFEDDNDGDANNGDNQSQTDERPIEGNVPIYSQ